MAPTQYVVLGGGISGLSVAWYLSKFAPKTTTIKLVEKSSRLGGWVHTKQQNGQVFELGPRTLRPVGEPGKAVLDMVCPFQRCEVPGFVVRQQRRTDISTEIGPRAYHHVENFARRSEPVHLQRRSATPSSHLSS